MKRKLRLSFGKRGVERDVESEIRFHIEMRTQEFIAAGMPPDEARRAAEAAFGDQSDISERCRDIRRRRARSRRVWELASDLWLDVRQALRSLRRSPVYTGAILITLALGIGANTAVFSLVNGVLLRPLPFEAGERLVQLRQPVPAVNLTNEGFSPPEIADYRATNRTFQRLVEYHSMPFTLLGLDDPVRVQTGVVSADFFDVLGVEAYVGRTFRPGEDRADADPVLVLSYGFWKNTLEGDTEVLGRELAMNDRTHTVVGVLPPLPQYPQENDVYMPVAACPFRAANGWAESRTNRGLQVFGRLKPGIELTAARADLEGIAADLHAEYPDAYPEDLGYATSVHPLREALVERARPKLLMLSGITALLLLIACANVANLTLARLLRAEREMAIRAALGAGRGRLLRETLIEGSLLAIIGGGAGLLIAFGGLGVLKGFVGRLTTRVVEVGIDGQVLLFTLALSLATGLIVGLLPALPGRANPMQDLRETGGPATTSHGRLRARKALIITQVAFSVVLAVGAGLLIRSFVNLQRVDPGFESENVVSAAIHLDWTHYRRVEPVADFVKRLQRAVIREPAVISTAAAVEVPLKDRSGTPYLHRIRVIGEGGRGVASTRKHLQPVRAVAAGKTSAVPALANWQSVTPDYFRTMGIEFIHGETFEVDREDPYREPVPVVINEVLAHAAFGEADPVGRLICMHECEDTMSVAGVVANVKQYGLDADVTGELYAPFQAAGHREFHLLIRTRGNPETAAAAIRDHVRRLDPRQAVSEVRTLEQYRSRSVAEPRLATLLLGLFAGLALAITAAGIGGVIAYSVGQRTREIGVRMVMGADPRAVARMVIRQGLTLVLVGLLVGIPAALTLGHGVSGLLFGVSVYDPITLVAVICLLALVALAACYGPARRATRIDPISTLRTE